MSDFITPEDYSNAMTIANRKHDVVAVQVYDKREASCREWVSSSFATPSAETRCGSIPLPAGTRQLRQLVERTAETDGRFLEKKSC